MTEPLMKQIVDLKDEHSLMLEVLKATKNHLINFQFDYSNGNTDSTGMIDEGNVYGWKAHRELVSQIDIAIKAADEGNKRRLERGNVDLPDRRGMKDGTT